MNRRDFLETTARTAAVAAMVQQMLPTTSAAPNEAAQDEDFWTAVRNEFTTDRSVINLNNGHVSPAPRTVQEAMKRYLDYSNMGPFHTMIRELNPKKETARRMLAEYAGVDAEEIAITRNSSEALEIAQMGVRLQPGDEVLTTDQDYPRMLTTFDQMSRRIGIKVKKVSFKVPVASMDDLYNAYEQGVTPATKLILVCHITNRSGQIFPIRRICDMAQARGITTIVDGAHAFQQFPAKISDLNCDYYGVSLHKWTFAPVGTGFLYVRRSKIKETWPLMAAGERQDDDIRKFEETGTYPAANLVAISEAMTFNQNIGIERKAARLRYLKDRWANRLAAHPKARIMHSPGPEMGAGIGMLAFAEGIDSRKIVSALESKYKIFLAGTTVNDVRGIRVTPSVYTTLQEIDVFASAVEKELASM